MKQVYRTEKILVSNEKKDFYTTSFNMVVDLRKEHPEFDNLLWSCILNVFENGSAIVQITVHDPNAPDYRENVKVALLIAASCIILIALIALIA